MGLEILRLAARDAERFEVVAALVRPGSRFDGEPLEALLGPAAPPLEFSAVLDPEAQIDVLLDFSLAESFDAGLALARARGCAFVSGTTGLRATQYEALDAAAETIPVLWASNFSLGVAALCSLASLATRLLGAEFDVEIIETHHRHKRDAPSGTAITLAQAVAAARGVDPDKVLRFARSGMVGEREPGEIGVLAVRGGDVIGEHGVLMLGEGERLELVHRVSDRAVFARGAVAAARWIRRQPPGRYGVADIFG
jgi:4-hydroxy-tetrahydrodipicolinate reductase